MDRQDVEICEAIDAVDEAIRCLDDAASDLRSAGNWGWVDIFGGGFLTSVVKHDRMDSARRHLSAAQAALAHLARELNDVSGFAELAPEVGDFMLMADWLFDNAFMDAMVQQRIVESQRRVDDAIARCEDLRRQLVDLQGRSGIGA